MNASPCSCLAVDELGPLLDNPVIVIVGGRGAVVLKKDERNPPQVAKLNEMRPFLTLVGSQTPTIRQQAHKLTPNVAESTNLDKSKIIHSYYSTIQLQNPMEGFINDVTEMILVIQGPIGVIK